MNRKLESGAMVYVGRRGAQKPANDEEPGFEIIYADVKTETAWVRSGGCMNTIVTFDDIILPEEL
jgi:hypothetical protein